MLPEGTFERVCIQIEVECFSSFADLLKHGVVRWDKLDYENVGCQLCTHVGYFLQGDPLCYQEMMNQGEHEHRVKLASGSFQEGCRLLVAPTHRRARSGEIDNQWKDVQLLLTCPPPELTANHRV